MPDDATPERLLGEARRALAAGKTGLAQEALERATTRLLDRSILASDLGNPSDDPLVYAIAAARDAIGSGDTDRAAKMIDDALILQAGGT